MALPTFARMVATIITPRERLVNGQVRHDWSPESGATRQEARGCWAYSGASEEDLDGRTNVTVEWTLLLPEQWQGIITEDSHVEFRGIEYAVDGRPAEQFSATGNLDHVKALLVAWEG